jgi:hypothetical protein
LQVLEIICNSGIQDFNPTGVPDFEIAHPRGPPFGLKKAAPETEMVIVHLNTEMVLNASKYFWR